MCVYQDPHFCPWTWPQAELGHSRTGEGTDDTGPLFLTLGCTRHRGTRAPGLLHPHPSFSISERPHQCRGAHVMGMLPGEVRPGLQSFLGCAPTPTSLPHTAVVTNDRPGPEIPRPDKEATCQASCQVGQGLHSKAAG